MIIIGICGASGSGKSTLAQRIKKALPYQTYILGQDSYYRDYPNLSFEERVKLDYDSPSSMDHDDLLHDIERLQKNQPITRKAYDYSLYRRVDKKKFIYPPQVLILEGIHIFYDARLCRQMSLKAYMHVDIDVCLLRRVRRDINKRGRSINSISEQYLSTVKPVFEKYISRYLYSADLSVVGGGLNVRALDVICAYIHQQIEQR